MDGAGRTIFLQSLFDAGLFLRFGDLLMENRSLILILCKIDWHQCMEIHEILSESARLIKTEEIYHTSQNDLVGRYAIERLLLHLLHCIDNPEGHAYR